MKKLGLLAGASLCALPACLGGTTYARPPILPLRTLHLYETGVGYFERSGTLPSGPGELAALPLPAGHLDDALKTLVVLDRGGRAAVSGVEFDSSLSRGLSRALAGLPPGEEGLGHRELLLSLRGAAVEVLGSGAQAGGGAAFRSLRGRLIEVLEAEAEEIAESKDADGKAGKKEARPKAPPRPGLLLLTDAGEIRRLHGAQVLSVRPTEPEALARLRAALPGLSSRAVSAQRLLRVLGRSGGPVTLGYVTETPIWRPSYRLVFATAPSAGAAPGAGSAAVLQGWALVHNDGDEEWADVQVRLVSGRPDSFLFPLGAPRYGRRELLHPEAELSTVPQLLGTTADALWGDHADDGSGGIGLSGSGSGGGGVGYGMGVGRIGTVGRGVGVTLGGGPAVSDSSLLSVGNLAAVAPASGVESGALFSYTMPAPLHLRAHGSALVPFLQEAAAAEPLTLFAGPGEVGRSAVLFKNGTKQTLPEGPLALFYPGAAGGFAGETILPRLKPGERRFLTFGADLDVELNAERSTFKEEVKELTFAGDALVEHYLRRGEVVYAIENRAGAPRRVCLQLALSRNARVEGDASLDYDAAAGKALGVLAAPARQRTLRTVRSTEGLSRRTPLKDLSAARMKELAALASLPAPAQQAAAAAAAILAELDENRRQAEAARAGIAEAEKDLARHRESAKALGGEKGAGAGPFQRRMVEAEDRITALRARIARLEAEAESKRKALKDSLSHLPLRT